MIDHKNVPSIFQEEGRESQFVSLNDLKGLHVAFNGYGISVGDKVTFPTEAMLNADPEKYIKKLRARRGSQNWTALILIDRNGKTDWFNVGVLTRTAMDKDATRVQIDEFRTEMNAMNDDFERIGSLLGKTIVGIDQVDMYQQKFDDNMPVAGVVEPAKFVRIALA